MEKKTKRPILEIVFYVFAALMAIMALYSLYDSYTYISDYAAMYGASIGDMGAEAAKYIISAVMPYIAYTVIIFGIGAVYGQVAPKRVVEVMVKAEEANVEAGEAVETEEYTEAEEACCCEAGDDNCCCEEDEETCCCEEGDESCCCEKNEQVEEDK